MVIENLLLSITLNSEKAAFPIKKQTAILIPLKALFIIWLSNILSKKRDMMKMMINEGMHTAKVAINAPKNFPVLYPI